MKNNEILVSVRFEKDTNYREMSFLVIKDITFKALIEAIYFGLKKHMKQDDKEEGGLSTLECYDLFDSFIRTHCEIPVLYDSNGMHGVIDFTEKNENGDKWLYNSSLTELGIVTSSCILITDKNKIARRTLFKNSSSYILKEKDSLEYNISSRRLNVIEPSIIDIIPPNDMPSKKSGSLMDVLVPMIISLFGMGGLRLLCGLLSDNSTMNNAMMIMTLAMPVISGVTSFYNYSKQKRQYKVDVKEWKNNYENYISRVMKTIVTWQDNDITYLNSVYPDMEQLFYKTA